MSSSLLQILCSRVTTSIKRKICRHENFVVHSKLGPTGRGKIWYSCRCSDCGQWFTYEQHDGRKFLLDGSGFGMKSV